MNARIVLVLLLAGFSVAITLSTLSFFWVPYEDTGISFNGDVVDTVPAGSPAAKAGLRVGDRLDPAMSFFDRQRIGWSYRPARGQTYTFTVIRNGVPRIVHVHAIKETKPALGSLEDIVENVVGMLSFLSLIAVGTLLVLVRPTLLTWMFFIFCIGNPTSAYFNASDLLSSLPMPAGFVLNIIRLTLRVAGYVALLEFALRFGHARLVGWRSGVERALPLFFVLYLGYGYRQWFWAFYTPDTDSILGWPYAWLAIAILCEIIAVASLVGTYRGASLRDRQRFKWVVNGVLVTYTVLLVRDVLGGLGMLEGDTLWICIASQSLSAFAPLALGYGILRHRVIDVSFVLNRAVVFASIGASLSAVLLGLGWIFATFFINSRLQVGIDFIVIAAMTLLLRSTYQRLVELVNAALFPKRQRRIQSLRTLRTLAEEADFPSVQALLTTKAGDALDLASAALFIRAGDGGFVRQRAVGWGPATAWHLLPDDATVHIVLANHKRWARIDEQAWTDMNVPPGTARPAVAIPLVSRKKVVGLTLYGAHTNDVDVDPDEAAALADLCALAAPALEQRDYMEGRRMVPTT